MKKWCKNLTVREYKRRCNTVENIHEVFCPRDRVTLVREAKTIIKNWSNANVSDFFSLFPTFSHLFVCSTKLSPVLWHSYLDGWTNTNTLCCNIFFFSLPFRRQYWRLQQGCALMVPGRLGWLTFGLGLLKKKSGCQAPRSWLVWKPETKPANVLKRNATKQKETSSCGIRDWFSSQ